MFHMKIETQLNLNDRTLLGGRPDVYRFPKTIRVGESTFAVLGVTPCVRPPYLSLEIEKTERSLIGLEAVE